MDCPVSYNPCCYADDTLMAALSTNHSDLTEKLSQNYEKVSNFMNNNRLKLNDDKSHLLVFNTSNRRAKTQSLNMVEIRTPTDTIRPTSKQKLLGCWVQDNLKWNEQLRDDDESLIKALNKRLNALKRVAYVADFKTRKLIAEGIFKSKLIYLISVWSGCTKELMNSIQIIQNRAARVLTKNDWTTSNEDNLAQLGWLSVYQLSHYHNILQLHQVKYQQLPKYVYEMYDWTYTHKTRQAAHSLIKPKGIPRLDISLKSFRYRAIEHYNRIPVEITSIEDKFKFKVLLKKWIQENVSFRP